jgi:hypothetical protein
MIYVVVGQVLNFEFILGKFFAIGYLKILIKWAIFF